MRRILLSGLLLAFLLPVSATAQVRFLVAAGFTGPSGDLSDDADAGYHAEVGLFVPLPTLPLGVRGDGFVHRLGAADPGFEDMQILGGTLSLVYELPGAALVPYVLAGLGSYQTESGPTGATVKVTDTGYHGGFGVTLGTGLNLFTEIRYVHIDGEVGTTRLIPVSFGLRL